jgi:hypothetical protein
VRRLAAALVLAVAVAGCSSSGSPAADLQTRMNAVTSAANSKDAARLRIAVSDFLQEVATQSQNGDITATRAQQLRDTAALVLQDASLLEQAPPTSAPPVTSQPTPVSTPQPTYSPKPKPSPTPEPTQAPPSPSPIIQITTAPAASSTP